MMPKTENELENKESNITNTNNNLGETSQENQGEEGVARMEAETGENIRQEGEREKTHNPEAKKKVRCKKWPQCKNENCEFIHPKETVRKIKY